MCQHINNRMAHNLWIDSPTSDSPRGVPCRPRMGAVVELSDDDWALVEHPFDPPVHCADLMVCGRRERARSAVEREPAQLVAQPLVVEHKFSDLVGELGALPLALSATSRLAPVLGRRRSGRPD